MSKNQNNEGNNHTVEDGFIESFFKKQKKSNKNSSEKTINVAYTGDRYINDLDESLKQEMLDSERLYKVIAEKITTTSLNQLKEQNEFKKGSRNYFITFFSLFLLIEYIVLLVLIFSDRNYVNNTILNTYMVSVFVETLGVIASMTKFVFDSKQENTLLEIINSILRNFKKFNENSDNSDNNK